MNSIPLPFLVGPVLTSLTGIGIIVCGLMAPVGRKGLTLTSGALVLVSGATDLILALWSIPIHSFIGPYLGFNAAGLVIDFISYLSFALFGAGIILLVFAATRRHAKPAVSPAPGAPRPPQGPHQTGPVVKR
ncbi:hypothetical protein KIK06_20235 [Nocardiopsis sp. EMB25]|uniref:hypothetical protein n=1 Tax=Nocardiopsis sp. EMB25 TaxID=2835867 RepID=UPI0022842505|nr:hypothetical protein [Nocardiopsis sp. EMB25]MCY9786226.1 hypothetical protein [Nocardiopsis sp. EMB25]